MSDATAAPQATPDRPPSWYTDLPGWARAAMQLGFAGLIAMLFALDSRERSRQLGEFQAEARTQAREDRTMYREEAAAQRTELRSAVEEMRRAIDALHREQRDTKRDVDSLKYPVPPPREK